MENNFEKDLIEVLRSIDERIRVHTLTFEPSNTESVENSLSAISTSLEHISDKLDEIATTLL